MQEVALSHVPGSPRSLQVFQATSGSASHCLEFLGSPHLPLITVFYDFHLALQVGHMYLAASFLLAFSSSTCLLPWRFSFVSSSSLERTVSGVMVARGLLDIMIQVGVNEGREIENRPFKKIQISIPENKMIHL